MNILVTGGGGFLGKAIVHRLLARGDVVTILGRSPQPDLAAQGVRVVQGDVADAAVVNAAAAGQDAIFHTAARVGSWGRASDFERTNVGGTTNVIAASRARGVAKLVYTSSPSVAHGDGDAEGINEQHAYPASFDAHYPRTKALAEQLVVAANGADLLTVVLRPHLMWGPGDTQLVPRAVALAKAGKLKLPGGPPKKVDHTYIDNAVDAHVLALDALSPTAACAGKVYFISQGEPLPQTELICRVLRAAGQPGPFPTVSPLAIRAAGAAAEAWFKLRGDYDREPPITRFVARQLTSAHWFDIGAAKRDLGYMPRVSFEEGLRRLQAAYESSASRT
ncbi:MAG: NAD-dependent epimerase/dehydratase family protein [Deltaproteobacteria bacterium]|nr:NAD-dependent epimerase/dehydratase family protein [Deltaproteobacteria bacterium]